jgi:integrase/recombinase XerD
VSAAASDAMAGAVATLVERYLDHLRVERGLARNSVAAYRRDLKLHADYLEEVGIDDPREVQREDLEAFVAWLRTRPSAAGRPYAAASVARTVVAVRGFHRFLAEEGETGRDPGAQLGVPAPSRPLPKALPVDTVAQLLAAPTGEEPLARRDRALLELLYGAGLRISELTALDLDDLDPVERLVRVRGKGDRERIVPYGEIAAIALDGWLVQGRPALHPRVPAVFLNARGGRLSRQGAWQRVKAGAERVGLADRVTPHTLRHSFATHLLDGGADVRAVQELLGHASVTTKKIYTLVRRAALREAYERAHPRAHRRPGSS